MWRFVEEGPLLKFPLRESPFMQADPMYRDVMVAPAVHFVRPPTRQYSSSASTISEAATELAPSQAPERRSASVMSDSINSL